MVNTRSATKPKKAKKEADADDVNAILAKNKKHLDEMQEADEADSQKRADLKKLIAVAKSTRENRLQIFSLRRHQAQTDGNVDRLISEFLDLITSLWIGLLGFLFFMAAKMAGEESFFYPIFIISGIALACYITILRVKMIIKKD